MANIPVERRGCERMIVYLLAWIPDSDFYCVKPLQLLHFPELSVRYVLFF